MEEFIFIWLPVDRDRRIQKCGANSTKIFDVT